MNNLLKYLIAGGLNFLFTSALFLFLCKHLSYSNSYALAFLSGIIFNVLVLPRYVFLIRNKNKNNFNLTIVIVNLCQLVLGYVVSSNLEAAKISAFSVVLVNAILNVTLSFILLRASATFYE